MTAFDEVLRRGQLPAAEALSLYDQLETVDLAFMFGRWRGSGLHTNHPMDGLLEAFRWYGKEFVDAENVHPLVFEDGGGGLFRVNPRLMPMGLVKHVSASTLASMRHVFPLLKPILRTSASKARLRMTEYRGKLTATMIYDDLPINDVFRKVDANTVVGAMDLKGIEQPFFFVLRREPRP